MSSFTGMIELNDREAELAAGGECVPAILILVDTDGDGDYDYGLLIYDCG